MVLLVLSSRIGSDVISTQLSINIKKRVCSPGLMACAIMAISLVLKTFTLHKIRFLPLKKSFLACLRIFASVFIMTLLSCLSLLMTRRMYLRPLSLALLIFRV